MPEETPKYYAVLTEAGAALEARALAEGRGIVLTHIVIGDANLEDVTPDPAVTALAHEVHRRPIDARSLDENDPRITLLHAVIPSDIGGFWIRELGVIGRLEVPDDDGESNDSGRQEGGQPRSGSAAATALAASDSECRTGRATERHEEEVLYAYANHAPYYKMLPQDGQTVTHEITVPIVQSTNARLTIQVADEGYATRQQLLALTDKLEAERDALVGAQAETIANLVRLSARVTTLEISGAGGSSTVIVQQGGSGGISTYPDGTVTGPVGVSTDAAAPGAAVTLVVE